ncbi:hypothetical protein ACF068_30370 [Streptomyces sp. NPDC016309]|uniref:hypothetical protein n=1 Tax=Streptomyces sp. NPDC016309 TaxID=3364965 RepID=UPI0037001E85
MNQLGDKPEEVRKRLTEEKRRAGRRDGATTDRAEEPEPAPPKGPVPGDALRERHPDAEERQ